MVKDHLTDQDTSMLQLFLNGQSNLVVFKYNIFGLVSSFFLLFFCSYCCHATNSAGAVADLAEKRKSAKYISLGAGYSFTPGAIKIMERTLRRGHKPFWGAGPQGKAMHWWGEAKGIHSLPSLCSCAEREHSFCVYMCNACISYMLLLTCYYY